MTIEELHAECERIGLWWKRKRDDTLGVYVTDVDAPCKDNPTGSMLIVSDDDHATAPLRAIAEIAK